MPDSLAHIPCKSKFAGEVVKQIRESAVADLKRFGTTSRMRTEYGLSRSDVQDLVLLGLIDEIRRLRPLQRRKIGRRKRLNLLRQQC